MDRKAARNDRRPMPDGTRCARLEYAKTRDESWSRCQHGQPFREWRSQPRGVTLEALRGAFEAAGIEFIAENGGGPGVRLRKAAK